ncbi:MAG: hypothetical protein ABR585_07305 [Gemmatimonadaceae bacterium]
MATYPHEAWQRLGELLVARRVELDVSYRNRRTFSAAVELDYRVLYDVESTRRTNFTKSTLRAIEQAYRLKANSLERTLGGGPLEPAEPKEQPAEDSGGVEIPETATPAEVAGMQQIRAVIEAQQRQIEQLTALQEAQQRELEELKERELNRRNNSNGDDHRATA